MKWLAEREYRTTQTSLNVSKAEKLSLAMFINTAMIPLIVHLTIDYEKIWGNNGLMQDVFWIMIGQAISIPVLSIFDIFYL